MKLFYNKWLTMTIAHKVTTFVGSLAVSLILAAAFNVYAMNYSTREMGRILNNTSLCETAQRAMEQEEAAFRAYIRSRTEENRKALDQAAVHTRSTIERLPYDYNQIGAERYARTRNIRKAYETYETVRSDFLQTDSEGSGSVSSLYDVYQMQEYLGTYFASLSQLTVEEGTGDYNEIYPMLQSFPRILIAISFIMFLGIISLARFFTGNLVSPIAGLAHAASGVMNGEYDTPDVTVDNRDELGELVDAFNRMKRSIGNNIKTLEENQSLQDQLHKEEIEHVNMERQLETIRLDLLQSQINPHFLFNTLNTIAGMAEIEEAGTSAQMIRALSNIFRYNLHTTSQFISLSQELSVTQDYMYLQQMRFGSRLSYAVCVSGVNTDEIMVPVFLLQPLVENAISHGITRKEQGGSVMINISMDDGAVHIRIQDTGVGMTPAVYEELMRELELGIRPHEEGQPDALSGRGRSTRNVNGRLVGIGVGNIYQRIHRIYRNGEMHIRTTEGVGTDVELILPQDEPLLMNIGQEPG